MIHKEGQGLCDYYIRHKSEKFVWTMGRSIENVAHKIFCIKVVTVKMHKAFLKDHLTVK